MKGVMYKWIEKDMGEFKQSSGARSILCLILHGILHRIAAWVLHSVAGVR